jgi:hypothetical protein
MKFIGEKNSLFYDIVTEDDSPYHTALDKIESFPIIITHP